MSRDYYDTYGLHRDYDREPARIGYCHDCRQSGGHASGCPGEDDRDFDDVAPTMSRHELIDLAGAGDKAALQVLANEVEFDGTIGGIDAATDEEIAEWYANELADAGRTA